ncbi:MAG: tetratricopeptide repeat protein [Thermoanaerobaculia bacterium]
MKPFRTFAPAAGTTLGLTFATLSSLVGIAGFALAAPAVARGQETMVGKIALTTDSADARAAYLHGRDLTERLRGQEARADFQQAVATDPGFAMAWLGLANQQPSAREFFEKLDKAVALVANVTEGERLTILGAQAGGRGDVAAQLKIYEELVQKYPNDERAQMLLGTNLFGAQRYADAISHYDRVTAINPGFPQAYNLIGYSYRFLGQMDRSEAAFKKYTEVLPGDPNPWDSYAELLLKEGRFDEAIRDYRKALAVRGDFVNSRFGIATCLDLQGKGTAARKELDAMLAKAADDGQRRAGLTAKAVSYAYEGNYAAAEGEIGKQLKLAEKIHDAINMAGDHVTIGDIALAAGEIEKAERHYAQALKTVEDSPTVAPANKENQRRFAIYNRAKIALAKNDLAEANKASTELGAAVASSGNPFQIRLGHEVAGRAALAGKQWDAAIAELNQANLLDPYNVYRLSLAYAGKGDAAKAQQLANAAMNDNTLVNLNLGLVRLKLKAG